MTTVWAPANNAVLWTGLQELMGMRARIDGPGRPTLLGDSITQYMTPHWGGLGACNAPFANLGFPGAMLQDLNDYAIPLLEKTRPSAAIVLIGVNNALDAPNSRPPVFLNGLGVIVPALRVWTQKVALATILPMERGIPGIANAEYVQPLILSFNTIIRQGATAENMCLLETYAAFAGADGYARPGYTIDGVHPSAAGYAALKPLYDWAG